MDLDFELSNIEFYGDEVNIEMLSAVISNLEQSPTSSKILDSLFLFIETNSDKHLGSPGPIVHFLEAQVNYQKQLHSSLERKPTELTVWMVNRIMNSLKDKAEWIDTLRKALLHPSASEETKCSIKEFIDFQN